MALNDINFQEEKVTKKIASFLCSAQNELTINISKLNFIDASRCVRSFKFNKMLRSKPL